MNDRGFYLRRRGSPWRWPVAVLVTLGLFMGGLVLTPDSWIEWFLESRDIYGPDQDRAAQPWLVLLPPPELEAAPAPIVERVEQLPPAEPVPEVADWWRRGWRIRVADTAGIQPRSTPEDSARYLLTSLGMAGDLPQRARPDSALSSRLLLMQREESYRFDELKPYLAAMTRARAYADLSSRVADMYDNFLAQEIIVPD